MGKPSLIKPKLYLLKIENSMCQHTFRREPANFKLDKPFTPNRFSLQFIATNTNLVLLLPCTTDSTGKRLARLSSGFLEVASYKQN